jgi:hypothetical protein
MLKQKPHTTAVLIGTSSLARLPVPDAAYRAERTQRIEARHQAWLESQLKSGNSPTTNEPSLEDLEDLDDVNRPETEADGIRAG